MRASAVLQACAAMQALHLTDVSLQVDKPGSGGAYLCPHPGGYKIQHGQLRPFPQAAAGPMMLVSGHVHISCVALVQYLGAVPSLSTRDVPSWP